MVKLMKPFLCVLALTLSYSSYALTTSNKLTESLHTNKFVRSDTPIKTITKKQYVGGGMTSILPGFGLGHGIQWRYQEKGWIFTASELATLGAYLILVDIAASSIDINPKTLLFLRRLRVGFLVVFGGLKIWEIMDAWKLPSHYKVIKKGTFHIRPLTYYNQGDLNLGLSFQYKF